MTIQEKIQKLNALNSELKSLNEMLAKNEQQLALIDGGPQQNGYSYYYIEGQAKLCAKPQHIRHALTHAIQDLKSDAREIERQLAELIK